MARLILLALALALASLTSNAQSSGRFQLVRSISGSKGAPDGTRFVMEDPRSVFQVGKDRQVLVTFEWQGPAGRHHCEGAWKDPSGKTVFTSEAEVVARGTRFGVYWGLSLSDAVPIGTWVIETRVDGELAGAHTFQIQKDPTAAAVATKRSLTVAELYQRGQAESLTLVALDASGSQLGMTSGFFVGPDLVSTSFAGINAARTIRVLTPDQGQLETSEVVSWNKRDDWAMLRVPRASARPVERAVAPLQVGDRCFYLEAQGESGRVIIETTVIGKTGDDLTLAQTASEASLGAPIFNEYGEAAAALAGSGILGAGPLDYSALGELRRTSVRGARARAIVPPPDPGSASKTLLDIEQMGLFVRPLVHTPHFVSGVLGTGIERRGPVPVALNQRSRFSRADGQCVVFVTWIPEQKQDTTILFELFDEDNHRLAATDLKKARLRSRESFVQYWEFPLAPLRAGVHRVDVSLGPHPVWRTFFRLND
jgi:hypothetical protein